MRRFILVPILGLVALAAPGAAAAQSSGWLGRAHASYADGERQSYNDARRTAWDNGYREGLKEGRKDGRRNDTFRFEDEKTFQRGDKGYHREFGNLERYRQSFRSGYADGYAEGYGRHARDGRPNGRYEDRRGGYGRAVPRPPVSGGVYSPDREIYYPDERRYPGYPSRSPEYGRRYPGDYRNGGGLAFQNGAEDGYEKGVEDARRGRSFDPLRHAWYRSGDRRDDRRDGSRDEYKDAYRQGFQRGYEEGYRGGYRGGYR